ncbi:hypothetical protein [Modestobacter sp. NPDC049651]|uniref:hypothetical protein n=1 Tax=unclassified Modestobacter TaxID=2643866 RepID=UPI0033C1865A
MTHSIDTPTQSPPTSGATAGTTGTPSTTDVAKDEARNVGQTAAQAGSQVASTAADQAKQVTTETKRQAQDLVAQGRSQLQEQARTGQQRAGQGLSEIAQQLRTMVEGGGQTPSGPAADLVRQAGDKVEQVAGWLQNREPGDLVNEVRAYARRRPGMFLLGAAVAGVVAGRLTGGVVSAHKDSNSSGGTTPAVPRHAAETAYPATGYDAGTNYATEVPTAGYAGGTTGYATTGSAGTVPPPPYGTVPPEGTPVPPATTTGWDDPARTTGEGRL